jgi:hypothetical protein
VWARIRLDDDSIFSGKVANFTADLALDDREIVLAPPLFSKTGTNQLAQLPDVYQRAVIRGSLIKTMAVEYRPVAAEAALANHQRRSNMSADMSQGRWKAMLFAAVLLVDAALVVRVFQQLNGGVIAAVVIITGLLIMTLRVFDIESFTVSHRGIKAKINQQDAKIAQQEQRLDDLSARLAEVTEFSMPDFMLSILSRIRKEGDDDKFEYSRNDSGLFRELVHLLNMGYVQIDNLDKIPDNGLDLRDYVKITDAGTRFLELRDLVQASLSGGGGVNVQAPAP